MSKPVKEMLVADYMRRFAEVDGGVVVEVRGVEANENNRLRLGLLEKNIHITVLKNTLARRAFEGHALDPLGPVLKGPSALAFGGESPVDIARELVRWAKEIKELQLKAAIIDGELFEGPAGVKRLSEFPTREEAQGIVVKLCLSPAGNILGASNSPGANIMGIVKEITERLEKGETIASEAN